MRRCMGDERQITEGPGSNWTHDAACMVPGEGEDMTKIGKKHIGRRVDAPMYGTKRTRVVGPLRNISNNFDQLAIGEDGLWAWCDLEGAILLPDDPWKPKVGELCAFWNYKSAVTLEDRNATHFDLFKEMNDLETNPFAAEYPYTAEQGAIWMHCRPLTDEEWVEVHGGVDAIMALAERLRGEG